MLEIWDNIIDKSNAKEIAVKWFNDRRSGIDTDWFSYSKNQVKNLLPEIDSSKKIVTYFHHFIYLKIKSTKILSNIRNRK